MTKRVAGHADTVLDTGSAGVPFDFHALMHSAAARPLLTGGIVSIPDHRGSLCNIHQSRGEQALLAEWNVR